MILSIQPFEQTSITLRDAEVRDLDAIVSYWRDSPRELFERMGIDVTRMPSPAQRRTFFGAMLHADPSTCDAFLFVAECDEQTIAYCLVNAIDRQTRTCQAHVHYMDPRFRGRGLASTLFLHGLGIIREQLGMDHVLFEPGAHNVAVNKLIRNFGLKPEQTYLKPAQGVCREMVVHRYRLPLRWWPLLRHWHASERKVRALRARLGSWAAATTLTRG